MSTIEEQRAAEVAETLMTVASSFPPFGNNNPNVASTAFGFGIDSDTSEAAVKAVRDALDRTLAHKSQQYSINILLGVPVERKGDVDIAKLAKVVPPEFSTKTTIQTGGLYVPHTSKTVVVASLSFEMLQATAALSSQTADIVANAASAGMTWPSATIMMRETSPPPPTHGFHPISQQGMSLLCMPRENSIDMLAQVSVELMSKQQQQQQEQQAAESSWASDGSDDAMLDPDDDAPRSGTSYKKLPPGKTPKNHERLFVKHEYRDFSHEVPMVGELSLVSHNAMERTPNAPFPLKLHEILAQIEKNGDDHIIGWLPHGRSFKIHDHRLFVDVVLPKYFIMNKKSSFLRQLNLYGFHRLSRVGSDQGSYYHEKFLKGMKFLCRRMARQKVNGNGIRAAGNPDQEPILSEFPNCPPPVLNHHHHHHQTTIGGCGNPVTPLSSSAQDIIAEDYNSDASVSEGETTANSETSTTLTVAGNTIDTLALDNIPLSLGTMQSASFPLKLQRILDKLESEQQTGTLSWVDHGRAFIVRDVARFVEDLAPVYFNLTKYSSFQRQCHMYHFQRITCGPDKGAYHHPSFLRGRPDLAMLIQRTRVNGKGVRRPGNPDKEPDFYSLPFRPPVTPLNFLVGSRSVVSMGEDYNNCPGQEPTTVAVVMVGGRVSV